MMVAVMTTLVEKYLVNIASKIAR